MQQSAAAAETMPSNTDATVMGGFGNTASGYAASVVGYGNIASGASSFAAGTGSTASGNLSTALGGATASGDYSVAMGGEFGLTTASGTYSIAMGEQVTAGGFASTAMGNLTVANRDNSTAMGSNATANHSGSFVYGDASGNTISDHVANSFNILATGGFNLFDDASGFASLTYSSGNLQLLNTTGTPGQLQFQGTGKAVTSFVAGAQGDDINYVLPTAQGTASTVLTNDGSGNLSWAPGGGGGITLPF